MRRIGRRGLSLLHALHLSAGRELAGPWISADAPLPGLELVVSFQSASLAGKVKPVEAAGATPALVAAEVVLVPRENQSACFSMLHAGTHPDGGFRMSSVPPGSYTAFAFFRNSKLDWEDPQVRQRFEKWTMHVNGIKAFGL